MKILIVSKNNHVSEYSPKAGLINDNFHHLQPLPEN